MLASLQHFDEAGSGGGQRFLILWARARALEYPRLHHLWGAARSDGLGRCRPKMTEAASGALGLRRGREVTRSESFEKEERCGITAARNYEGIARLVRRVGTVLS